MNALEHSIVALSSGRGPAGIAVVRMSGPRTAAAVERLAGTLPPARRASLRRITDPGSGEVVDTGLVIWIPGPGSFTGEDMAEFHVHGGRAVVVRLQELLVAGEGVRLAEPGEFTRRAFDNGKLDLTEVEGLADVIAAETEAQRRQAVRQMQGALGAECTRWRETLKGCLAYLEAELDFSDEEDVPRSVAEGADRSAAQVCRGISKALEDGAQGERLRDGIRVVIAGAPNAGKSTLLNALAKRDAAIVSERAGTTRDVIEVHMDLGGYPVTLVDTAGLRAADDPVEQEGVRRAQAAIDQADLTLWLSAADEPAECPGSMVERGPVKIILSKADLMAAGRRAQEGEDVLFVSARSGEGLDGLGEWLQTQAATLCGGGEAALITRSRHRSALEACLQSLLRFAAMDTAAGELRAEELRAAVHALGRITGRVDVEELLDVIFRDFCIGK